jgi:thiosulfate dehydrogenase [quinone] large subunit
MASNKRGAVMNGTQSIAKGLAALRIVLGTGFLYAGLEKVLNFAGDEKGWSAFGFLKFGTGGSLPYMSDPKAIVNPTHDFWLSLTTNGTVMSTINFLVVFGEVAIGIALILGLATRFAGVAAVLMMGLFYVASWSFEFGPISEQFLYGTVAAFLVYARAGEVFGLDAIIERTEIVKRTPQLRYVLG